MIRPHGIDHLVLRVADLPAVQRFYVDVLGAALERRQDELGLVQLRVGLALIDLVAVDGPLGRAGGAAPGPQGRNLDHFCLRIDPFDEAAIRRHLAAHGVAAGLTATRYGAEGEGPSIYVADPEGNVVELKGPPAGLDPGAGETARRHQLHGVQPVLPVADVDAAAAWFRDLLGFEIEFVVGTPAQHGRVRAGDGRWGQPVYIHLARQEGPVAAALELRLHVGHDLDGLFGALQARGAALPAAPVTQPWGLREFVLATPDGHRLRLCAEA